MKFVCNIIVALVLLTMPISGFAQQQDNNNVGGPRVSANNDEEAEGNGPRLVESNQNQSSTSTPRVNATGTTFGLDGSETGTFKGYVDYRQAQAPASSGSKRKGGGVSASSYIKSVDERLKTLVDKSTFTDEDRKELATIKKDYDNLFKAGLLTKAEFDERMSVLGDVLAALKRIEDKIDAGNAPWYGDWSKWVVIAWLTFLAFVIIGLIFGLYFSIRRLRRDDDSGDVADTVRTVIREELRERQCSNNVVTPVAGVVRVVESPESSAPASVESGSAEIASGCRVSESFESEVLERFESLSGRVDSIDDALGAHVDYHQIVMEPGLARAIGSLTTTVNEVREVQGRHSETLAAQAETLTQTNSLLAEMRDALNANGISRPRQAPLNYDGYSRIERIEPEVLPTSGGTIDVYGEDGFEFLPGGTFYIGKNERFAITLYHVVDPHHVRLQVRAHRATVRPETNEPLAATITYYGTDGIQAVIRRAITFRDEDPTPIAA